jgi:hypothetical protein
MDEDPCRVDIQSRGGSVEQVGRVGIVVNDLSLVISHMMIFRNAIQVNAASRAVIEVA